MAQIELQMTMKCEMGDYAIMVHGVSHGAGVDRRLKKDLSEPQLGRSRAD